MALRGLKGSTAVACNILIADVLLETYEDSPANLEIVTCLVGDMVYDIPNHIVTKYETELKAPGSKIMYVEGASLPLQPRDGRGNQNVSTELIVPPDAKVVVSPTSNGEHRLLGTGTQRKQGTSRVLVVRVVANDASSTMSPSLLYDRIFSDGSNVVNERGSSPAGTFAQTYKDCSFGKMNFLPAEGYDLVNGVGLVSISMNVTGVSNRVVENKVTEAINDKYGSVNDWDHIM